MSRYGTGKNTTDEYKRIDVRFLRKHKYLVPGVYFTLSWSRRGERIAWIQCRTTDESIILMYKHRRDEAEDWKNEEFRLENQFLHFERIMDMGAMRRFGIVL